MNQRGLGFARTVGARVVKKELLVGCGDEQNGARVRLDGSSGVGLKIELGGADGVLYEENFFGAVVEDVQAADFFPRGWSVVEFFVLQNFYGDVAEWSLRDSADGVGEGTGRKSSFTVGELERGLGLAFYAVDDCRGPDCNVNIVVAVPVRVGFGSGRDFDVEDADLGVFEGEVMVGFGCDFYGGLSEQGED